MKYAEIGEELQEMLRRTTASVIYHKEKIKREYIRGRKDHPLMKIPIFYKDYGIKLEIPEWKAGK